MRLHYYSINDFSGANFGSDLTSEDVVRNPELKKRIYQFVSLLYNPNNGLLYCGLTNFAGDIFYAFDPRTKEFESLHYREKFGQSTDFDIKIHRSLEFDNKENAIYSVSSGLHAPKDFLKAPGAHLFKFDCAKKTYEDLGCPVKNEYTQTITYDALRKLIYGFTLEYFSFYVFSIKKKETIYYTRPNSITHVSALDNDGCIWSTWGRTKHDLFKYDPEKNDCVYFDHGFPEGGQSYMYPGAGPIDRMLNIGDGFLYVALETGSLYKLEPKTARVEYLGKPRPQLRLPGLAKGISPHTLLGVTGDNGGTFVFEYNLDLRNFKILAELRANDVKCYRPHDLVVIGKTIYVAETDNPKGKCHLWELEYE